MKIALAAALTLGNAFCGFAGIAALLLGGVDGVTTAATLTFVAWGFDVVDGMVARLLGAQSGFGATLDSMCDVVSFGVLPALLVVVTTYGVVGPLSAVCAALYLAAEIVRLARFTVRAVEHPGGSHLWYDGLPSSVGGMGIAAVLLWGRAPWPLIGFALIAGALMHAPWPYVHLVKLVARRPVWLAIVAIAAALCVVVDWRLVLVSAFVVYLASGAVIATLRRRVRPA